MIYFGDDDDDELLGNGELLDECSQKSENGSGLILFEARA